ncbi:hypothetical protein M8818_005253 [Zalaria obscura]|uniref:Uncharacterized protein n=1 Tax=Zalaria obscura TaxID=2024903 RepID=A0ACC3S9J6_9PEZI
MPNDIELPEFPTFTQTYHHAPYAAISPSRPELSAAGKVVVVTGGGTGIGRSIAVSFAQAGADTVAILGRREDRLKSSVAEISAANQKTKMLDYVAAEHPQLHVVNLQPGVIITEIQKGAKMEGQDDVRLPGDFAVWLASPEAKFLKNKFVWANWDVEELKARAEEIQSSRLLTWVLDGVPC